MQVRYTSYTSNWYACDGTGGRSDDIREACDRHRERMADKDWRG